MLLVNQESRVQALPVIERIAIGGREYFLGEEIPLESEAIAAIKGTQLVVARRLAKDGSLLTIPTPLAYNTHKEVSFPSATTSRANAVLRQSKQRPPDADAIPKHLPEATRNRVAVAPAIGHIIIPESNQSGFEVHQPDSCLSTMVYYADCSPYPLHRLQYAAEAVDDTTVSVSYTIPYDKFQF